MNKTIEDNLLKEVKDLENGSLEIETLKRTYSTCMPWHYYELSKFTSNDRLIEILNNAGDNEIKRNIDDFILPKKEGYNCIPNWLFYGLEHFEPTWVDSIFKALELRIKENSVILNQEIYVAMLDVYKAHVEMKKKERELSDNFFEILKSNSKEKLIKIK